MFSLFDAATIRWEPGTELPSKPVKVSSGTAKGLNNLLNDEARWRYDVMDLSPEHGEVFENRPAKLTKDKFFMAPLLRYKAQQLCTNPHYSLDQDTLDGIWDSLQGKKKESELQDGLAQLILQTPELWFFKTEKDRDKNPPNPHWDTTIEAFARTCHGPGDFHDYHTWVASKHAKKIEKKLKKQVKEGNLEMGSEGLFTAEQKRDAGIEIEQEIKDKEMGWVKRKAMQGLHKYITDAMMLLSFDIARGVLSALDGHGARESAFMPLGVQMAKFMNCFCALITTHTMGTKDLDRWEYLRKVACDRMTEHYCSIMNSAGPSMVPKMAKLIEDQIMEHVPEAQVELKARLTRMLQADSVTPSGDSIAGEAAQESLSLMVNQIQDQILKLADHQAPIMAAAVSHAAANVLNAMATVYADEAIRGPLEVRAAT